MLPRPIYDDPEMITENTYMNFLRYFKRSHPSFGLRRLLQEGRDAWDDLTDNQQQQFERARLLRTLGKFYGKHACTKPKRPIRKRPLRLRSGFKVKRLGKDDKRLAKARSRAKARQKAQKPKMKCIAQRKRKRGGERA